LNANLNTSYNAKKHKPNRVISFEVHAPANLLEFLIRTINGKSRNNIKSLLTHREVTVDGVVVTQYDYCLKKGQKVCVENSNVRIKIPDKFPDIVFENDEIIVVNKPAGLVTVSTDTEKTDTAYRMINDYLRDKDESNRIFIVHRLDRDTSGLLLFAKNEKLKFALQDNWNGLVKERAYIAIVEGIIPEKSGKVHSWLRQTKTLLMYSSLTPEDGLEAITHYKMMKESNAYSMVEIHLETGRKNQIRVHMKDIGHSVVGDKKYGAKTNPLKRLGLHANKLEVAHPFTNKIMSFESPLPECFKNLFSDSHRARK